MQNEALLAQIKELSENYGAEKTILFGSRARGDNHEKSDVDIAIYGMPTERQAMFALKAEEIDTLLELDIVYITKQTNKLLVENIERDGIIIMDRMSIKLANLVNAINRLREAVDEYNITKSEVVRDGTIQRFEFSAELAWKSVREYLIQQGFTEINSPKAVMKTAFSCGVINDENGWLNLLNDRNSTSHIYDEESAARVYDHIVSTYILLFEELIEKLIL